MVLVGLIDENWQDDVFRCISRMNEAKTDILQQLGTQSVACG